MRTGLGWVGGAAGLTGDCLIILLGIMVLCALPCVRRKGYFEVYMMLEEIPIINRASTPIRVVCGVHDLSSYFGFHTCTY